jgi:hypothetical protein
MNLIPMRLMPAMDLRRAIEEIAHADVTAPSTGLKELVIHRK